MKRLLLLFLLTASFVHADVPPSGAKGVLILTSATGKNPISIAFSDLNFGNFNNGEVTDLSGVKTVFADDDVGKIVYLDRDYYQSLHDNTYFLQYGSGLKSRETLINISFPHIVDPQDAKAIKENRDYLQDIVSRFPQSKDLLQPQVDVLTDDLSRYDQHQVFVNGQWMTQEEAAKLNPAKLPSKRYVSFTTKDGKKYDNVEVMVTGQRLSVLTSSGGASVPFDQLPDDLSIFPAAVQQQIKAGLAHETGASETGSEAAQPPASTPASEASGPSTMSSAMSWFWGTVDKVKSMVGLGDHTSPSSKASGDVSSNPSTANYADSAVIIKGDEAQGTGFLVKVGGVPVVITNLHVISANPNFRITTNTGAQIQVLSLKGAIDRDLAMFVIKDAGYHYLKLADASSSTGDDVITPGNSEGGGVILNTRGKVLGVGSDKIEISNPVFHGNSGGPIVDVATGNVLGVVTGASMVEPSDAVDKASLSNPGSAIKGPMRYFGLRVDNVPQWEPYDIDAYLRESTFLKQFHDDSRSIDSLLNGAMYEKANLIGYGAPDSKYYLQNAKVQKIEANYAQMSAGLGAAQNLELKREMILDLSHLADTDLTSVENPGNFYSFDRLSCAKELEYRKALKSELGKIQDKMGQNSPDDHLATPSL
jgi:hypothetical protein